MPSRAVQLENRGAIIMSSGGAVRGVGPQSAASWLAARGVTPPATQRWHVEIALDVVDYEAPTEFDEATATRFHLDIYSEEWGLFFCHGGSASWIRVTDIAFVHGRDQHHLLGVTPPLQDVGRLVRNLEKQHGVKFQRQHAAVRTNLASALPGVRAWLATL